MSGTTKGGGNPEATNCRENQLSVGDQCELLANPKRRTVLRYLITQSVESFPVEVLSEYVAAREPNQTRQDITYSLRHRHLPKMADAGVIRFDPEDQRVEYRSNTDLERHLAFLLGL